MLPTLSIALATNPTGTVDMTALTSPGGVWNSLQGITGADWQWYRSAPFSLWKREGGTLGVTTFGANITPNINTFLTATWTTNDENSQTPPTNSQCETLDITSGHTDNGIQWTVAAPYGQLRTFTWIGKAINGGTFTAKITISDGSTAPKSVVVTSGSGFTCSYAGATPTSTVTIELRITAAAGGTATIFNQAAYIGVPVLAAKARGWTNYLRLIGVLGNTANA